MRRLRSRSSRCSVSVAALIIDEVVAVAGIVEDHEDLAGELAQEEGRRSSMRGRRRDRRRLPWSVRPLSMLVQRRVHGHNVGPTRSRTPVDTVARPRTAIMSSSARGCGVAEVLAKHGSDVTHD